jgi:hypothetical protein
MWGLSIPFSPTRYTPSTPAPGPAPTTGLAPRAIESPTDLPGAAERGHSDPRRLPHPALALLGALVSVGHMARRRLPRWAPITDELVTRGTRRWQWWLTRPPVAEGVRVVTIGARWLDQWLQDSIDDASDRGEELLAYAELYRWRLRRLPERAVTALLRRLGAVLGPVIAPLTQPIARPGLDTENTRDND